MLLAYQGIVFGAFMGLHFNRGLLVDFLGWVSIHGVTEFGAIILCGAGGLVIAQNILFPGRHSRMDNLAAHGRSAAQFAVGAVFMFFVAGLIEGGLRQLVADTDRAFCHRALTGAAWLAMSFSPADGCGRELRAGPGLAVPRRSRAQPAGDSARPKGSRCRWTSPTTANAWWP